MPAGPHPTTLLAILSAALVAVIAVWPAATAHAEGAVMVAGRVSPHDREVIVDTVRGEGTAVSLRFSSSVFGRDAADASMACLKDKAPWSCVSLTVRGKDQIVIVEVDSDRGAGAPMTIVTAHLLTAGAEDESFATRNCEMCNEDALRRTVSDLCRALLQRAAARTGRTRLAVHSRPDGAQITLDGTAVNPTAGPAATFPGRHTVVLQLPGYAPLTREVVAIDGRATEVTLDLEPAAQVVHDERRHGSQFLPGLAVGVGAAALAAGGLMIGFDQDPNRRGQQQPHYYDTAPLGVVTAATGAVLAGIGVYYLLRSPSAGSTGSAGGTASTRSTGSTATLTPLPGGAAVGWAGRF